MGVLKYIMPEGKVLHPTKWKGTTTRSFEWGHPGLDIAYTDPTPVYAVYDGEIVESKCDPLTGFGGEVVIRFDLPGKGTIYARYGHLESRKVEKGDRVETGQEIGTMGGVLGAPCSGMSTGRHLHLELANSPNYQTGAFDPAPYLAEEGTVTTTLASALGGNPTRNLLLIFAVVFGLIYFILKR